MKIQLTAEQVQRVIANLNLYSDSLRTKHRQSFLESDKTMYLIAIREIDRLSVEIEELLNEADAHA